MELQNIKSRNLQQVIKEQIKYYIINSNLKMGDALPTEKFLSNQLGISRTVIRESLKGLQAIGLIEAVHGKGIMAVSQSFTDQAVAIVPAPITDNCAPLA